MKQKNKEEKQTESLKLTIPESLFSLLKKERDKFSYFSVQEVILEALREKFYKKMNLD